MSENLELWLVRHGETTRSVAREIAGWSDPPLTEKGRREAAALRPRLNGEHFDGVWSSDLQRTVATAELAWGAATPDRRLRELNFGDLEEQPFSSVDSAVAEKALRFQDFKAPGGESVGGLRERLELFLAELRPGRHLVFTHGGVIRTLTQGLGLDRFVVTGSLVGVDWTSRKILFVAEPEAAGTVFEE
jgi:probable phosphoglycerate mutase